MNIRIIGDSINALTAAVMVADMGHTVFWHGVNSQTLLTDFHFEHALISLYRIYVAEARIRLMAEADNAHAQLDNEQSSYQTQENTVNCDVDWFFGLPSQSLIPPCAPVVILSGEAAIGSFERWSQQHAKNQQVQIYYVPFVFVEDGKRLLSIMHPTLLLIGSLGTQTCELIEELKARARQWHMDTIVNTELARAAIPGMLATRVSFMNEMAALAEAAQADITQVALMMGMDTRIGNGYLSAGSGFAGTTLPNEIIHLQQSFDQHQLPSPLVAAVDGVNQAQKEVLFRKVWQHYGGALAGLRLVVWGGAYKAGSGRTDNAPIHTLLPLLLAHGVTLCMCAYKARMSLVRDYGHLGELTWADDFYAPLAKADAVLILDWPYALPPDIGRINAAGLPVFDSHSLHQADIAKLTVPYVGVGR